MNKFNVGDKVVRTGDSVHNIVEGGAYTVEVCDKGVVRLLGHPQDYCASYFELAEKQLVTTQTEWTDKHYDAIYKLTEKDIERGWIKIDPYRVSKQWRLGSKDESGALFHVLKTLARIGEKNSVEREVKALLAQIKCFAEIEGVEL